MNLPRNCLAYQNGVDFDSFLNFAMNNGSFNGLWKWVTEDQNEVKEHLVVKRFI